MILNNVYIYVKKNNITNCIKYGMKLSDYSDISFKKCLFYKKGITGYFTPKDNLNKYNNENYDILRIKINNDILNNIYIIEKYNNINNIISIYEYNLGMYKDPNIILSTSIFPEYIFKYNRIIDVPLLISSSKEIYNEIKENEKAEFLSYIKSKSFKSTL